MKNEYSHYGDKTYSTGFSQFQIFTIQFCDGVYLYFSIIYRCSGSMYFTVPVIFLYWPTGIMADGFCLKKELQRVSKTAIQELDGKDILLVFPEKSKRCKIVRILKTPKTESSVRKIFLPKSVALLFYFLALETHKRERESLVRISHQNLPCIKENTIFTIVYRAEYLKTESAITFRFSNFAL
jgi:hypothetical protein